MMASLEDSTAALNRRRLGAAVLGHFAFERERLLGRIRDHPGEGACQHAGLAGRFDRNCRGAGASDAFDSSRQLHDRARQRSRDQQRERRGTEYGNQAYGQRGVTHLKGGTNDDGVGHDLEDSHPFAVS